MWYATLGQFFAWLIGWDLLVEYSIGAAAVAVGWSGYVVSFLDQMGIHVPPQLTAPVGTRLVFLSDELIRTMQISVPEGWYQLSSYSEALQRAGISSANLDQATAIFTTCPPSSL